MKLKNDYTMLLILILIIVIVTVVYLYYQKESFASKAPAKPPASTPTTTIITRTRSPPNYVPFPVYSSPTIITTSDGGTSVSRGTSVTTVGGWIGLIVVIIIIIIVIGLISTSSGTYDSGYDTETIVIQKGSFRKAAKKLLRK